jgi:hypothetical protein
MCGQSLSRLTRQTKASSSALTKKTLPLFRKTGSTAWRTTSFAILTNME